MNDDFGSILEPDPVVFLFEAPGWTYLMILLGISVVGIGLRWAYVYHKNTYRRMALDHLQKLTDIGQINLILKSLALRSFERHEVAELYGERWIEFLMSKLKNHTFSPKELNDTIAKIWDVKAVTSQELNRFKLFSSFWIKHYHV